MHLSRNRLVVKVGTSTLTNELGGNNLNSFDRLARALAHVHNRGYETILVTSGAIAVGGNMLGLEEKPSDLRLKQAAAAVGQCGIMKLYAKFFADYDKRIAQILLTAEDMENERKKENLVNTFEELLRLGVIPVVNENDSVSHAEIESEEKLFGDNDMLSAVVAILCRAHKLVIFSDIDGLFDGDPRINPRARLLERVSLVDDSVISMAGGAGSRRGTGGMKTKLCAARLAALQGIDTVITNGRNPESLSDIMDGAPVGTLIMGGVHVQARYTSIPEEDKRPA